MKRTNQLIATKKLLIVTVFMSGFLACSKDDDPQPENPADMPYEVNIDPADFESANLTGNDFFPLSAGKTFVYEGEDEDGAAIRVEEFHTGETKVIMGVTCAVVRARQWEDDELVEDTYDWYAQDLQGNVWYFGEDTKEMEGGEVVSTAGSWEAGVDGALPGIIMFDNPLSGVWYRQEYYEGEAEDVAQVLSLSASVTVPYGEFGNCLQTAEWSLLEPGVVEHKFYSPGVGLVRSVTVKGDPDHEDLKEIKG